MDIFPKFIIETDDQEGDCLIVAKCTYHKQLATNISKVKGGGWWTLDRDNSIFTLSGDSDDFGRAKIKDIASCVQRKKVFSSASLHRNFTDNFKFQYKDQCGEIFNLETYGSRRLFLVTFLGKDEYGEIVKAIEVMADSSEDAMSLIKEISMSREIYSAIDV